MVNATNGAVSIEALESAGEELLTGKVILDLSNELIPVAEGFPIPAATATSSVGQRIQQRFPGSAGGEGPEHHEQPGDGPT